MKNSLNNKFGYYKISALNLFKYNLYNPVKRLFIKPPGKDIYVVSYPKSGRTWLKKMLNELIESNNKTAYVHGNTGGSKKVNWHKASFDVNKMINKNVIFLVREPKDTIVSSYYQSKYRDLNYLGEVSEYIRHPKFGIKKILAFHNFILSNKNRLNNYHIVKYENLLEHTKNEIIAILTFLGEPIKHHKIEEVIEKYSFKNMHEQEKKGGFSEYSLTPVNKNNTDTFKVRKGKVGGYKETLSDIDISYCNDEIKEITLKFYN